MKTEISPKQFQAPSYVATVRSKRGTERIDMLRKSIHDIEDRRANLNDYILYLRKELSVGGIWVTTKEKDNNLREGATFDHRYARPLNAFHSADTDDICGMFIRWLHRYLAICEYRPS
jgi:hypothetical protein